MAEETQTPLVRVTVIIRIPDVDPVELSKIMQLMEDVKKQYGGDYDINFTPQKPGESL